MAADGLKPSIPRLLFATFRRDFSIALSYRLAFLLRLSSTVFQVVVFFFISKLMGMTANPLLADAGGRYFDYVLIGLAFQRLFSLSLTGYANAIGEAQRTGTLEAQAILPVSMPLLITGANLWPTLYASLETIIYLLLGVLLGASLAGANVLGAVLIALFASLAISGLGFMGAAIILLYKRGNAVAWVVETTTALVAGVYFPPDILPAPLQNLSFALPQTYALTGLRSALLQSATLAQFLPTLAILAGFAIVLLPLGIAAIHLAYRKALEKGSLAQY
jgi:ABC-2 type transport system permease protein